MPSFRDIILAKRKRDSEKEPRVIYAKGVTMAIDYATSPVVNGRPGYVWVKENGEEGAIFACLNISVANLVDLPVVISKHPTPPFRRMIVGVDWDAVVLTRYAGQSYELVNHAKSHQWPTRYPGHDAVSIYPRALTQLKVYGTDAIAGTPTISVVYGYYMHGRITKVFPGLFNESLASYLPVTVGNFLLLLVYLNPVTNAIGFSAGSPGSDELPTDVPSVPNGSIPLAYIRLYEGMTYVSEADIYEDPRPIHTIGSVVTDDLWDAKGDLAVGTGADTAERLPVGTDSYVLTADSSESCGLKWTPPSGGGNSGTLSFYAPASQFAASSVVFGCVPLSESSAVLLYGSSIVGKALVADVSNSLITYNTAYQIDPDADNVSYASVDLLDSTHLIITYGKHIVSAYYPRSIIATISGSVISFGSIYDIDSGSGSNFTHVTALDASTFVVLYPTTTVYKAVVGTIAAGVITYGTPVSLPSGANNCDVKKLTATSVVITYVMASGSPPYPGKARVGTISGSNVTLETEYEYAASVDSSDIDGIGKVPALVINSTHFIIAYSHAVGGVDGSYIIAGELAGTVITFGSAVQFGTTQAFYTSMAKLDSQHFIIVYGNGINSTNHVGYAVEGIISGTTMILYEPVQYSSGKRVRYTATGALNATLFMTGGEWWGGYSKAIIGTLSGVVTGNLGTVTEVDTGTGLTGGPITDAGTVALANTAVTPGSYTNANITVDQQGRLTAAADGVAADGDKITELPLEASPLGTDLLPIVHDPGGSPVTNKTTIADVLALVDPLGHVIQAATTPMTQRANLDFEGAGVAVTDSSPNNRTTVTILGPTANDLTHNIDGAIVAATDMAGFVASKAGLIDKVYLYGFTLGTSSSTIVDIHKNGTTIFTTQGNRPTLAYNDADKVAVSGTPDVTSLAVGDVLTIDIDQAAVGAVGLTVVIAMSTAGMTPATPTFIVGEVFRSSDLSLTSADHVVPFDTEIFDTDAIVDIGTYPNRLTCNTEGYYQIIANATMSAHASTAGLHQIYIMKNGTDVLAAQGGHSAIQLQANCTILDYLHVGDYVELHAYHDEGGTVTLVHGHTYAPVFSMHKVG